MDEPLYFYQIFNEEFIFVDNLDINGCNSIYRVRINDDKTLNKEIFKLKD